MSFNLVQGDLAPEMLITVTDNGLPDDISDATDIMLAWRAPNGSTASAACTPVNLQLGQIKYSWLPGDTDIAGYYQGRVTMLRAGGKPQTYPSDGSWIVWSVLPR